MKPNYLPGRVYYYLVEIGKFKLTFHSFQKFKRGDTVKPAGGLLTGQHGTVLRRCRSRKGYSYRIEPTVTKVVELSITHTHRVEVEV